MGGRAQAGAGGERLAEIRRIRAVLLIAVGVDLAVDAAAVRVHWAWLPAAAVHSAVSASTALRPLIRGDDLAACIEGDAWAVPGRRGLLYFAPYAAERLGMAHPQVGRALHGR